MGFPYWAGLRVAPGSGDDRVHDDRIEFTLSSARPKVIAKVEVHGIDESRFAE
jgi:hypothetical protein